MALSKGLEERTERRIAPVKLNVAHPPRREDQRRTVAHRGVRDIRSVVSTTAMDRLIHPVIVCCTSSARSVLDHDHRTSSVTNAIQRQRNSAAHASVMHIVTMDLMAAEQPTVFTTR